MSSDKPHTNSPHNDSGAELSRALRAAASDSDIARADHEALLALTLGDDVADFSDDERRAADTLRQALAGEGVDPLAELAEALRCAAEPRAIDQLSHERLIQLAFMRAAMRRSAASPGPRRVAFVMAAVAAAAAITLVVLQPEAPVATPSPTLILSHSTAALFDVHKPWPRVGGESGRIDRIAQVREKQLRANRFAAWGIR
jgi:hypothetical protein